MKVYALSLLVLINLPAIWTKEVVNLQKKTLNNKIVGGSDAPPYQFPYQISYQVNLSHVCGGVIIQPYWLVTAAHCLIGTTSNTRIVAGVVELNDTSSPDAQITGITVQVLHPLYTGGISPYDIGLVRVENPFQWSAAVQPLFLPSPNQYYAGLGWVTGFGYLSSDDPVVSNSLQYVRMGIMSNEVCQRSLGRYGAYLTNNMVCAGGMTGYESVCNADSGGGLMQNNILLGIGSWTLTPCGQFGIPSVFTRVSDFVQWIRYYVPYV